MEKNIRSFSLDELTALMSDWGQPGFRAKQLHEWLHKHNATSYDQLTNLPKSLREQLASSFPLYEPKVVDKRESKDGTRKYLIELCDGLCVETVGMMEAQEEEGEPRVTVCCSTQVGCPMDCSFCATGKEGFARNLTADEIVDQLIVVEKDLGTRINNVVLMGQGEPFMNYDSMIDALHRINTDEGLNIGARKITISTSGLIDGIYSLIEEPEQFRLAVSLHSAIQTTRNRLMPRLANQPLEALHDALLEYSAKKNRRITLEYMLIEDVNDSEKELDMLIAFCDGIKCHVNLIPFNKIDKAEFQSSSAETQAHWMKTLSSHGIPASLRYSKGSDIAGACGQLKEVNKKG